MGSCAPVEPEAAAEPARAWVVGAGQGNDPLTIDLESTVCKSYGFGTVAAITPAAMEALDAIRPVGAGGDEKVFGLSDWEFFGGHSGRVGMARRVAQNGAPTTWIHRVSLFVSRRFHF